MRTRKACARGTPCPALEAAWQGRRLRRLPFIFKRMEQGRAFASASPNYATKDPNYRIIAANAAASRTPPLTSREKPGPDVMRVASFFPFQTTYYLNGHSFHRAGNDSGSRSALSKTGTTPSQRSTDVPALQAAADKLKPRIIVTARYGR